MTVTRTGLEWLEGDVGRVRVTCSAGFYVRAFAHSLGELVGTGACLEALRRTRSGDFTLENSIGLDGLLDQGGQVAVSALIPLARLLPDFPAVTVASEERDRVSHGQEVEGGMTAGDWVRLLDKSGHLIAIARRGSRPGFLHPAVVLI
jgi:tRNA pseudouridine55 synthase